VAAQAVRRVMPASPPAPILLWLRNDLRLHDHEPLHAALAMRAPVIPVYCVDPRHYAVNEALGVPKAGPFRARFLLESLADLRASCRALGGDLVVRVGEPETVLPALAQELGATAMHYHAEVTSEEVTVEQAVTRSLAPLGVRSRAFAGHTLVHRDDLPFEVRDLPEVFTRFRNRVERDVPIRESLPAPAALPPVSCDAGALPTLAALGLDDPAPDPRALFTFVGGERAGLERLSAWIWREDRLRTYKQTRNGLLHPDDASRFSAWLAHGCVSPRRIHDEVRRYERTRVKNDDTHWLVVELLWRDYFRFVAEGAGARLFAAGGVQGLRYPWRTLRDRGVREELARWTEGRTGFPLVDAAMRELTATGFMSNRARQNVASFLARVLGIDWRLGAAWFESWLVDYDVSSNWGNWMYVAGVGNDARGFRFFNVYKQAQDYDPNAEFIRHWLPALATLPTHLAHRPEQATTGVEHPAPMVDMFRAAKESEQRYMRAVGARPTDAPRSPAPPGRGSRPGGSSRR
jgi:deoxyribodipyrimidine photo-lyase